MCILRQSLTSISFHLFNNLNFDANHKNTAQHNSFHFSRQFWKKSNHSGIFIHLREKRKTSVLWICWRWWFDLIWIIHITNSSIHYLSDLSMDSDFWTSRLAAAKRQYTLQHHHPNSHLGSCWLCYGNSCFIILRKKNHLCSIKIWFFAILIIWGVSDRLGIDDFDMEEEVRPDFPCPYCYEDFDIASLCSHLEDEHSCESRVTVGACSFWYLIFVSFPCWHVAI